jgi:hypothetical protein
VGVEVFASQPVAVAQDFAVLDESVDHRGGGHVVPEDFPQAENGLLLVTIIDACS